MNGVRFGALHSYNDLDLLLTSKTIETPKVKTMVVDVVGGDGQLDYTEYFGKVNYYNRKLSFEFSTIINPKEFLSLYSRLQNLFNGKKMQVTLDDDPDFYYIGRVTVNEWKSNKRIGLIAIEVDAEPYKLKQAPTVMYRTITQPTAINCHNLRKSVIPKITLTTVGAEATISFGENYTSEAFKHECPDELIFEEGQNVITVIPTANSVLPLGVRIEYQEGSL